MAWTTPRTWAVSEVVTPAMMNTHVRDNLNWLNLHHGCRVYMTANQTVGAGNTDPIAWTAEDYDTDALHSTVTNTPRIVVPTGLDGYWRFEFAAESDADAANHNAYFLTIRKNSAGTGAGTLLARHNFTGHTNLHGGIVSWQGALVATDYIECYFGSFTEARAVQGGSDQTALQAIYLGG